MKFEVFYDGDCPLCMREIQLIRWLDRRRSQVVFTDITDPDFDSVKRTGLSHGDLMAEIYGRTEAGELVRGMEVFRQLYGAVGLGLLFAPTAWRPLRPLFDAAYTAFAKHRLRLTGRCTAETCEPQTK